MSNVLKWDNKKRIFDYGDYVRVYINCPYRGGWIMESQVPKSKWNSASR